MTDTINLDVTDTSPVEEPIRIERLQLEEPDGLIRKKDIDLEYLASVDLGIRILGELRQFIDEPDQDSPLHQKLEVQVAQILEGLFLDESLDPGNLAVKQKSQDYLRLGIKVVGPLDATLTNRIMREVVNTNYQSWISAVEGLLTEDEKDALIQEFGRYDLEINSFAEALDKMLEIGYVADNNPFRKVIVNSFRFKNDQLNGQKVNLKEIVDKIQFAYSREYDDKFPAIREHREKLLRAAVAKEFALNINTRITKLLGKTNSSAIGLNELTILGFGSTTYNMSIAELIHRAINEETQYFDLRCGAWQWNPESTIPFGNFSILGKDFDNSKRSLSRANVLQLANIVVGRTTTNISDLEIETTHNGLREDNVDSLVSYRADVQSKMLGVDVRLVSDWINSEPDRWENYQTLFLHFYNALVDVINLKEEYGDFSDHAFSMNSPISRDMEINQVFVNQLADYFSSITSRNELLHLVQRDQDKRSLTTSIQNNLIEPILNNHYQLSFSPDCVGFTLRSIANDLATYFLISDDNQILVEAFDDLPVYSPNTLLATQLLPMLKLILLQQRYTLEEKAYFNLTGLEA